MNHLRLHRLSRSKPLRAAFDRGCVETAIKTEAQAALADDGFSWSRFWSKCERWKWDRLPLAASSSSHILPDGHHQFVSSQQIDDSAQVVTQDMQAHLRFDVLQPSHQKVR